MSARAHCDWCRRYAEAVHYAAIGATLCDDCSLRYVYRDELLLDMDTALKLAEQPIQFAIEPIAACGFVTVLAGRHSSVKSMLMMASGHAAHSGGGEVAGLRCERTTTLYVDAENGPRLVGRRFRDTGIPANGLRVADGTCLRLPRDIGILRALVADEGAGLVVLDSLRRLAPTIREERVRRHGGGDR